MQMAQNDKMARGKIQRVGLGEKADFVHPNTIKLNTSFPMYYLLYRNKEHIRINPIKSSLCVWERELTLSLRINCKNWKLQNMKSCNGKDCYRAIRKRLRDEQGSKLADYVKVLSQSVFSCHSKWCYEDKRLKRLTHARTHADVKEKLTKTTTTPEKLELTAMF